MRYFPILRLRYDSSSIQLRDVTSGFIEILENDERIDDSSLFSRFSDFRDDAILIKVSSYIKTTDYLEFLGISEELNYRIIDIVRDSGTGFALPGKSIYMESPPES